MVGWWVDDILPNIDTNWTGETMSEERTICCSSHECISDRGRCKNWDTCDCKIVIDERFLRLTEDKHSWLNSILNAWPMIGDRQQEELVPCSFDDLELAPSKVWVPKCWQKETETRFGCLNYDKFSSYPGCVECPYRNRERLND